MKNALNKSGKLLTLLAVLLVASCTTPTRVATATEKELCRQWRDSLPSRSRNDTQQTQREIGTSYDVQNAVCAQLGLGINS